MISLFTIINSCLRDVDNVSRKIVVSVKYDIIKMVSSMMISTVNSITSRKSNLETR